MWDIHNTGPLVCVHDIYVTSKPLLQVFEDCLRLKGEGRIPGMLYHLVTKWENSVPGSKPLFLLFLLTTGIGGILPRSQCPSTCSDTGAGLLSACFRIYRVWRSMWSNTGSSCFGVYRVWRSTCCNTGSSCFRVYRACQSSV